jgi:hypothetical protein
VLMMWSAARALACASYNDLTRRATAPPPQHPTGRQILPPVRFRPPHSPLLGRLGHAFTPGQSAQRSRPSKGSARARGALTPVWDADVDGEQTTNTYGACTVHGLGLGLRRCCAAKGSAAIGDDVGSRARAGARRGARDGSLLCSSRDSENEWAE